MSERATTVAIVGAGTMGSGIAQSVIAADYTAMLIDAQPEPLVRAQASIERSLARAVERGTLTAAAAAATLARLTFTADLAATETAGIVIEAIPEDVALKRRLFAALGAYVDAAALIATNTSAIRLDALADAVPDPQRFVGLHYFFPAASNKLLEIVRARSTSDASFERAQAFARATKKVGLPCRDSNGFVVNRFFVPWLNEAVRLDDEGAPRASIEQAGIAAFAAPLGPFALMVLTKTAIALHAMTQLSALGAFYDPAPGLARQVATGDEWLIPEADVSAGPEPDPVIVERLQAAVWFAMGELLDEHVCDEAALELGAATGLRWGSGPVAAFRADRARGLRCVEAIAARHNAEVPRSLARL